MIDFAKRHGVKFFSVFNHEHPMRSYLTVTLAICVLQGLVVVQATWDELLWINFPGAEPLPFFMWWTAVEVRALVFLVLAPLFAAIIVDTKSSVWGKLLLQAGVYVGCLFIFGNLVHPCEHYQFDHMDAYFERSSADDFALTLNDSEFRPDQEAISKAVMADETATDNPPRPIVFGDLAGCTHSSMFWVGEFLSTIVNFLLITAVGYAVSYYLILENRNRQAEELKRDLEALKHEMLSSRLQPHFLFNTLNTIGALTLSDAAAARTCIGQLGELLHESLEFLPEKEISLERELEIVDNYLKIQQVRFGDMLNFSIQMDPRLSDVMVPAFLLQPLVENSFEHGFKEQEAVASISISATLQANCCRVEIEDNGVAVTSLRPLEERHGLGLTRQRLQWCYGGEATVDYESNVPCGMKIIVTVPTRVPTSDSTNETTEQGVSL